MLDSRGARADSWRALLAACAFRGAACWLAGSALVAGAPVEARAEAAKRRVAIVLDGPKAVEVRPDLAAAFPSGDVLDPKASAALLTAAGWKQSSLPDLTKAGKKRDELLQKARASSEQAGAVVVVGRVSFERGARQLELVVVGDQGEPWFERELTLPAKPSERAEALAQLLQGLDARLRPAAASAAFGVSSPAAPAAAPAPDQAPRAASEPTHAPHQVGSSLVFVELAFQLGGRDFAYSDPVSTDLRPYGVLGAPMGHAALRVHPLARTGIPVLSGLGLSGRYDHAFLLGSATAAGDPLETTWIRAQGGLELRLAPAPKEPRFLVVPSGSFVYQSFLLRSGTPLDAEAPTVEYLGVRAGLELRIPAGPLAVEVSGGYVGLVAAGATNARFRDPEVAGMDLSLGLALPLPLGFETRLAATYDRYFYAFHPDWRDTSYIAGGALDQLFGARLGIGWRY